jgi:PAS domain S-box-containing protein
VLPIRIVENARLAIALSLVGPRQLVIAALYLLTICAAVYFYRRAGALKYENKTLRALVYDRPDVGVAEFRFGRHVEHCNQTLERMFGMTREQIIGKSLPLPECRRSQWEELEARLRSGQPFWHVETVRARGDGSLFRAYISAIPIFDRDHVVVGHLGMIMEEKWVENREAEALRLAALADNSSDFLVLLNRDLRIIYANPTVAAMTGIDFDLIDGTEFLECFAENDRDAAREHFHDFLESGIDDEYSPRLRLRHRETGVETLVQFGIYPVFESPGEGPAAIACVAKDRSSEMALGHKLKLKQKEIRTLLEHVPVGVVSLGIDGIVTNSNRSFQELMGYTADEIRNTPFGQFVHPDELREGRRRFLELAAGSIDQYKIIKRLVNKSGQAIRTRMTVVLLRHEDGASSHAVAIVVPLDELHSPRDVRKLFTPI